MHNRIDAVAGSAPGRLLPVESIPSGRSPQDEQAGSEPRQAPAVSFSSREDAGVNAYAPSSEVVARTLKPDPVAPALAEALAAEPWGHPMPAKAVWEQVAASRAPALTAPTPAAAPVTPAWLTSLLKAR